MSENPRFILVKPYAAKKIRDLPDVEILIRAERVIPDLTADCNASTRIERMRAIYASEAKQIVEALCAVLPGGTVDALLVELLDRKRSTLKELDLGRNLGRAAVFP